MSPFLRLLLILVVGTIAFSNSLGNPLLLDDQDTIVDNPQIRQLGRLDVLMPERELPVAGRPLANLTFALNYAAGSQAVRGYHVTNLALHLLCAIAALLLVEQVLRLKSMPGPVRQQAAPIALTVALLWVVHPLNSEVVNYVTERTESLMGIFFLLTIYASVRALESRGGRWPLAAATAGVLGALCKESIAVAPLVVVAFDRLLVFPSWRDAWHRRRGLYGGLAVSWIVLAALQSTGPRPLSTGFSTGISVWTYLLNQAVMIGRYLRLAVWPKDLVVLYGLPAHLSLGDVIPQGLIVLALLAATVIACRRWPAIGAAGVWFFLTLAPTSSVLPIATEVGAERRMYLPLLSITVLAVCALWQVARNVRARAAVTIILTLVLGTTTFARNAEYADPLRLAELTVARWPTGMTHQLLAEELLRVGRRQEAIDHLRVAVPDTPRARFTLGQAYLNDGRFDDAIAELRAFVRLEPYHLVVPSAEALIARAYGQQQRWDDASEAARSALAKAPGNPVARLVLAEAYFAQKRFGEAIVEYRRYLVLRTSDVNATTNLAISLMAVEQVDEGLATFRRAAAIDPGNWQTRRNLALALLDTGHVAESIVEAKAAVTLSPEDALIHTILGQGLARSGDLGGAAAQFERAVELDPHDTEARGYLAQVRQAVAGGSTSTRR